MQIFITFKLQMPIEKIQICVVHGKVWDLIASRWMPLACFMELQFLIQPYCSMKIISLLQIAHIHVYM